MRLRIHTRYLILTLVILLTEVLIALYVHDGFIRPYVGDFLVVILLYCFVMTFLEASVWRVATGVLLFSLLVETGQYFHLVSLLGLDQSAVAKVVLGNSFGWMDIVMYMAGIACAVTVETIRKRTLVLSLRKH